MIKWLDKYYSPIRDPFTYIDKIYELPVLYFSIWPCFPTLQKVESKGRWIQEKLKKKTHPPHIFINLFVATALPWNYM